MTTAIYRAGGNYHRRKPLLTFIGIIGVALGVAVVIGIQLANRSALESFRRAAAALNGKATHTITTPAGLLPEDTYVRLERQFPTLAAAPVCKTTAAVRGQTVTLLGIDPLAERRLRPRLYRGLSRQQLVHFLTTPGGVIVNQAAARLRAADGSLSLPLPQLPGRALPLQVIATIDDARFRLGGPLIIGDLSWVQPLYPGPGRLSRLDLALENPGTAARIAQSLPPGINLSPAHRRHRVMVSLLHSFELNLTALSLLSLFVGFFLIYNTIVFLVLQRRRDLGILLTLGVSRGELAAALLAEVMALAAFGSLLGIGFGYLLAAHSIKVISRTISDLYFFLRPGRLYLHWHQVFLAFLAGGGASLAGAALPLREVFRAPIVNLLSRRVIEDHTFRARYRLAGGGLLVLCLSLAGSQLPGGSPYPGFLAAFGICLAGALMTPLATAAIISRILVLGRRRLSIRSKLGISAVCRRLSRTAPAIAALAVALAMSLGITLMIGSFRGTLATWFRHNIQGDYYVSGGEKDYDGNTLPAGLEKVLAAMPGVAAVNRYRSLNYEYRGGIIRLTAIDPAVMRNHSAYQFISGSRQPWEDLARGQVLVSESFANKYAVRPGDTITLTGTAGERTFAVAAIYRDYVTEQGIVLLAYGQFQHLLGDRQVNSLAIFLRPGVDRQQFGVRLRRQLAAYPFLTIYANARLRRRIMEIFDRSFAITVSTRFIAVLVAFFGIVSALLAVYLEAEPEYGILQALGLSPGEIFRLNLLQSVTMGLLAAVLAGGCGPLLAWVLIKVINLKSFGWTIDIHFSATAFGTTAAVALFASLVSGLYPAYRISRSRASFQMREG